MAVFHFSTNVKAEDKLTAINFLMKSDSIYSFEVDKERNLLTVITTGNIKPQQIQQWLKDEGFECELIK